MAPSTKQQSYNFVSWKQVANILGQPFDATRIPFSKLHQMRFDPMIAFGLQFVKTPLVRAKWFIECDDPQIKAFVECALREVYSSFIFQYCNCLDFGFSPIVKRFELRNPDWTYYDENAKSDKPVWPSDNVEAILWKPFVALPPERCEPRWNTDGEFDGIVYDEAANSSGFFTEFDDETGRQYIDVQHALWATNEKDKVFGSVWGYPRTGYAYRFWWSYWYNFALADRFFEKHADPPPVVHYPDDEENILDDNGQPINYREIALSVAEQVRSGAVVAMPSTPVMGFDEKPLSMRQWEIEYLQQPNNFQAFNDRFNYMDTMKLRAVMVPDQAFEAKGSTAGYGSTSALQDAFRESQAVLMAEADDVINRFMIPQLIAINFPDKVNISCRKITKGFAEEDIDFAKQIIQLIGQQDPTALKVDVDKVFEQIGVPQKSPEQILKEQKVLQEQVAQSMPPGQTPVTQAQAQQAPQVATSQLPGVALNPAPAPQSNAAGGSKTGF